MTHIYTNRCWRRRCMCILEVARLVRLADQWKVVMKPVDQDKFEPGSGNCFQASVASIMELSLDDVPHFMQLYGGDAWWPPFCQWLNKHGYVADWYPNAAKCTELDRPFREAPTGYSILSGESPRFSGKYHAVVALDGVCVHDPHVGDRRGVGAVLDYIKIWHSGKW